ncbi:MAG: DUF2341 domain-containing protein, partial [Candidatus Bathyarchaeota archaeon]|nr:DUF2341 domain-containing protein [Candidatus Bathyarchaeota archaeon]
MQKYRINKIITVICGVLLFSTLLFSTPLLPTILNVDGSGDSWLEGWTYRKSHFINNCTGAGTNYPVQVTVDYGDGIDSNDTVYVNGMCQVDFDDIRFTEDDGNTTLDYWMEDFTLSEYATFWVELSTNLNVSNTTIYLYYGNSTVATT